MFAWDVWDLIETNGINESNAIMLVAQRHGVGETTVRNAWDQFEQRLLSIAKRFPLSTNGSTP